MTTLVPSGRNLQLASGVPETAGQSQQAVMERRIAQPGSCSNADAVSPKMEILPENPHLLIGKDAVPFPSEFDSMNSRKKTSSFDIEVLTQKLNSLNDPIGARASWMRGYSFSSGSISHWSGPVQVRRWKLDGKEVYGVDSTARAYGCGCILRADWIFSTAFKFVLCWNRQSFTAAAFSMRLWVSFPTVVPPDATIVQIVAKGNICAVRHMFEGGRASHTDTTPDGSSLLHVGSVFDFGLERARMTNKTRLPQEKISWNSLCICSSVGLIQMPRMKMESENLQLSVTSD